MMNEPTHLEIFMTKTAQIFYGKSVYKGFADQLPIDGGEMVLDFGCGMGTVAYYVAKKLDHGQLTCLDISDRWINACRKTLRNYENVVYVKCDSCELTAEYFDLVYCHFVLHEISKSELARVIPELAKSLKPGGVLVFREPFDETEKINVIKRLSEQNRLILKNSRITDIPLMGYALESIYIKQ